MLESRKAMLALLVLLALLAGLAGDALAAKKKKKEQAEDPYAEYVWPPPPDEARIKLERVIRGRIDVEARSRWGRKLLGASPRNHYDLLQKPFAVAFDAQGRILVTDSALSALIRFDREDRRMDVLGTRGAVRLKIPLGLDVAPEGIIFVADAGLKKIVALDPEGKVRKVYGREGELVNPTDAALSPDGSRLFVADSKAHEVVVFDPASGQRVSAFGKHGVEPGEFSFPTSLAFDPEGNLLVVDQINSRVQMFSRDGEYLDGFGGLGVGFGNFVRPKDVAVDEEGFIYVTDNAFNNVQLFDTDFTLLTFVGEGGRGPGRFHGASGVAVQGPEFAVVDQLGRRVQLFRFLTPKVQ
jgi:sugar lactone lactonase YvrE